MISAPARYVPAGGRRVLTPVYDRSVAATMREGRWRPALVARVDAGLEPGGSVVDVGAGTGTIAIAIAGARPDASVVAVDGDPDVLGRARIKPGAGAVRWRTGLAGELALEDASTDAVVMSLLLHHLDRAAKDRALAEARRVLRPGGLLHMADWGRPHDRAARAGFLAVQLLDGFAGTRDHAAGRLPEIVVAAGLRTVTRHERLRTVWGTLELLEASR